MAWGCSRDPNSPACNLWRSGPEPASADEILAGLTACGFVIEICDLASGAFSAAQGDWVGAGLSTAAIVPIAGWAPGAAKLGRAAAETAGDGVSLSLKYKDGWTAAQRSAADEKVAALDAIARRGDAVVTQVERSAGSAAGKLRRAGVDVPSGVHGDHLHDLQLGGADTLQNLWPLDGSVNSSLGAQIASQIRGLPVGTCVVAVRIC